MTAGGSSCHSNRSSRSASFRNAGLRPSVEDTTGAQKQIDIEGKQPVEHQTGLRLAADGQ